MTGYWSNLLVLFGIYAISAIGLNFAVGVGGVINLGQAAFSAIGAYCFALLTLSAGVSLPFALVCSVFVATVAGTAIGLASRKLRGDDVAIGTLGFGVLVEQTLRNCQEVTRGPMGISDIPQPALEALGIGPRLALPVLVWVCVLCSAAMVRYLATVPFGRVLQAVRDDETLVRCLGSNPSGFKVAAMGVSALCGGLAGVLYATYVTFIDPATFGLAESMLLLFIVLLGGAGTVTGPFLGVSAMLLLQEPLRYLTVGPEHIGAIRQMSFAGTLLAVICFWPRGLGRRPLVPRFKESTEMDDEKRAPKPTGCRSEGPIPARRRAVLECRNISKRFGNVVALSHVGFEVSRGQIIGVIGPNGAGKSTLLNVLTGMETPDEGNVFLEGTNTIGLQSYRIAQLGIARTFQQSRVHSESSVLGNMNLSLWCSTRSTSAKTLFRMDALRDASRDKEIEETLEQIGLWSERHVRAGELSFGQRKLLQLAMAMARKPRVLLLDEPASGLYRGGGEGKRSSRAIVAEFVLRLARSGVAIVVVEQDTEFIARVADGVMVLNQGEQVVFSEKVQAATPLPEEKRLVIQTPEFVRNCPEVLRVFLGSVGQHA